MIYSKEELRHAMLLYAVTDRAWTGEKTLYEQVEDALKGGVTCVQLREKRSVRCAAVITFRFSSTITWRSR